MRTLVKYGALALLGVHLCLSSLIDQPTLFVDLILYNSVSLLISLSVLLAPRFNDLTDIALITIAFLLWSIASTLSSAEEFFTFTSYIPEVGYTLFYPFMLLALPRIALKKSRLSPVELIDSAIIGLGITALLSAVILVRVLPGEFRSDTYFALFNSVGDLLLLATTISSVTKTSWNHRSLALISGIAIYCLTDLLYFWQNVQGTYRFGQMSDDGWLCGLALIALALWFPPSQGESPELLSPVLIAVSVLGAATLLALIAINPNLLPSFILAPALATLFMAFIRMAIALRQAKALSDEKVLARTDELTGLANRRRLISELQDFSHHEGALLLMDLDGFKPINDRYGHEVGDKVLRHIAQRFQRVMPQGALLARLGGDEFGALVPGDSASTFEVALALRATMSYPLSVDGHSISVGVSIGCVTTDGSDSLLRRADSAMYEAKRSGSGISTAESLL